MIHGLPVSIKATKNVTETTEKQGKYTIHKYPELWKIYSRLCDPKKPVSIYRSQYLYSHPPILTRQDSPNGSYHSSSFPSGCSCYEHVLRYVREVCRYYSPVCRPRDMNASNVSKIVKAKKKTFKQNASQQIPMATLVIRWQIKRDAAPYDVPFLRELLSTFGKIRDLRRLTINSVIVTFESLKSACSVMAMKELGFQDNYLHCRWWHRRMEDKYVCRVGKGVGIFQDRFLKNIL